MTIGRKTGGRTKGTVNKDKAHFLSLLAEKWPNYHPVIAMAGIANDETVDLEMRFAAHKEVAQYVEPKRKAIEHTGAEGGPMALTFGWLSSGT
jgi:hypothetical protein